MDRLITYPAQVPLESDLLNTNRNIMVSLGKLAGALFGTTNSAINGLLCTPSTGMAVSVGAGELYSLQPVDATAYGTLPADTTDTCMKQGIQIGSAVQSTPAPTTAGQSIVYLIEGRYQDNDVVPVVLPYYNAANPLQAFAGPGNNGVAQATERKGIIAYQVKAGIAATTGAQLDPTPDSGWTPLWLVTIAYGATSVVPANIRRASGPLWLSPLNSGAQSTVTFGALNISPADGASGVTASPTLVGDAYFPLYGVLQAERDFQIIQDGGSFDSPYWSGSAPSTGGGATPALSITASALPTGPYQWRYRDLTVKSQYGAWSVPTAFTTSATYIVAPSVVAPANGAINITAQPVITLSAFTVSGGSDTQNAVSLRIMDSTGAVVWLLTDQTFPLNNITLPPGILLPGTAYTLQGRQSGTTYGESAWSTASSFTTASAFNLQGTWAQRSGGATARSGHAAAAVGGVMYVHGGSAPGNSELADLWAYTQLTDSWMQLASAPTGRAGHAMVAYNGNLYVVGGYTSSGVTAALSTYNPTTNAWSALTSMPAPLDGHTAVVIGSKMYVYGGSSAGGTTSSNSFYAYDLVAGTWSTLAGNPSVIQHGAAAVGGIMYICGGYSGTSGASDQLWSYNPSTTTWTQLTPIAFARLAMVAIGIGSGLYIYGGAANAVYFEDLQVYDTVAGTWSSLRPGPYPLNSYSAAVVNGAAYYFGGIKGSYTASDPGQLVNNLYSVN